MDFATSHGYMAVLFVFSIIPTLMVDCRGSSGDTSFQTELLEMMNSLEKQESASVYDLEDYSEDDGDFIRLAMGAPATEMLQGCGNIMQKATDYTLADPDEEQFTFQYGPCRGDPGFCEQMATFLSKEYGDTVNSADVMVTAGATQGLHLVATVMFDKNTPIFMEDPTYFKAVKMLSEDLGRTIIPVPTDDEGLDLGILEDLLKKHRPTSMEGYKTPFWTFIYCVPTFNNPKGFCITPERARGLIQIARKYDVLLLTEDVYNMIHYYKDGHCPPRLLAYDNNTDADYQGNVLSNCTFSKILAPGLRVGWIEAPHRIMQCLEKSNTAWSGGAFNHYMSKVMASAIKHGLLSDHLCKLRKEYGDRMEMALDELKQGLPTDVRYTPPQGGFFIWLQLPDHIDTIQLLATCVEKHKMNFIFGKSTSHTESCGNCVRLSISYCPKARLREGVARFCSAVREAMAENK